MALHGLPDVSAGQFFAALGEGSKNGDVIMHDFHPGSGTRITINGDARGVIAGDEFYSALLRIWLGDRHAEES